MCIIFMWVCKYAAYVESRASHQIFPLLPHDSLSWNWTLAFLANKLLGTVCFCLFLQVLGCSSGSRMCLLGIQTQGLVLTDRASILMHWVPIGSSPISRDSPLKVKLALYSKGEDYLFRQHCSYLPKNCKLAYEIFSIVFVACSDFVFETV